MIYIGCHLSVSDGFEAMGKTMLGFGGNTYAFFPRNPRGGKAADIVPEDANNMNSLLKENSFGPLVVHGSYTMNLCSAKPEVTANALDMFADDLKRMENFPGNLYNFHPGSHVGQGTETGIAMISDALNKTLWPEMKTTVLLETMAGKGSEVGSTFEELREIIDRVELKDKVAVCFDTCHTWDSGYDIVNNLEGVLTEFDKVIGLERLKAVHFNDSKNDLGSHKDRHEKIGLGFLGEDAMKRVAMHPSLQNLPFILETPNDDKGYIKEIHQVLEWFN